MMVKPVDSKESPFRELELNELWDGTGKTRVRQHVNPLRRDFQTPPPPPDWSAAFEDPSLPLALDIGSGYGRFLLLLQRNNPERNVNYLGIEIRHPLVERSNEWAARLGVAGRVHYVFANATVSLETLLAGYPGPITDVFIQFPDPHFKKRHHKRRVVQPQLVAALKDLMPPGGRLLLQSDVEEASVAMRNMFERHASDAFELAPQHTECPVFLSRPTGLQLHESAQTSASASCSEAGAQCASAGAGQAVTSAAGGACCSRHSGTPSPEATGQGCSDRGHGSACTAARAAALGQEATGDQRLATASTAAASVSAAGIGGACFGEAGSRTSHTCGRSDNQATGGDAGANALSSQGSGHGTSAGAGEGSNSEGDAGSDSDTAGDDDGDIGSMVSEWAAGGWLVDNPVGTPTEREHYVGQQGLPVYRVLLVRR